MRNPLPNRNHSVLDTDRIGWLLVKLSMPVFLGLFVQALYNVISTIFIGRVVGTEGIAGLSITFPLQMTAMGLGMMVGIGGLSVISRSIGAGDIPRAERALGNSFTVSVALSLLVMVIIMPFVDFWLRLIGASDAVLPYARPYLLIVIGGTVFNTFAMALLNLARAEGNARVGMVAMILGAVLSIIFGAVFIIWMKMGVVGAGLSTVIAQIIAMIYLLSYYFSGRSYLKIHVSNFAPDFEILKSMFAIGSASFVQTVTISIAAMILISGVVGYGGDMALSAFGIVQRIMMFANLPAMVIGQGLQPILGFNYGARRYRLGLKAIYLAYVSSTILCIISFILVYLFAGPIVSVFRNDPELIEMGTYAARLTFLALPLMGLVMVSQMIFQALGRAVQAFTAAIVRPMVFLIPAVLAMPRFWELDGVFLSLPTSDFLTFILVTILLMPIIREFRKTAAKEPEDEMMPITPGPRLDEIGSGPATG